MKILRKFDKFKLNESSEFDLDDDFGFEIDTQQMADHDLEMTGYFIKYVPSGTTDPIYKSLTDNWSYKNAPTNEKPQFLVENGFEVRIPYRRRDAVNYGGGDPIPYVDIGLDVITNYDLGKKRYIYYKKEANAQKYLNNLNKAIQENGGRFKEGYYGDNYGTGTFAISPSSENLTSEYFMTRGKIVKVKTIPRYELTDNTPQSIEDIKAQSVEKIREEYQRLLQKLKDVEDLSFDDITWDKGHDRYYISGQERKRRRK